MMKVGIVGASGYTGAELLRLLAAHPTFEVAVVTGDTKAGVAAADLYPSLAAHYGDLTLTAYDPATVDGLDAVFCGLPHGASQAIMPELVKRCGHVVDLSADFRLSDASLYPEWYGSEHAAPELLDQFVYGIPELFRAEVEAATHIANPGCYPTAAALALVPLIRAGLVSTSNIVVDAASGVSGAGRAPKDNTTFCAVDEDFAAYGLLHHRHTPEIDMAVGAPVLFTPHLAPMNRGILATCYARPGDDAAPDTDAVLGALHDAYDAEPFVVVRHDPPHTKATLGANTAHVSAGVDPRTGWVVAICAIDNLVKGASGQAVQCANIVCGLPETAGLPTVGLMP
jgi:N-acetyl-gamma-glutamyl-phosphate reductase